YDPQRSLRPASNLKLLTTGTALALLGTGYRFKTELQHDGRLSANGRLEGNLYLKGYGDPSLGSPLLEGALGPEAVMEQLRLAVQRAGIRSVSGKVIADASVF
ncbi:D-alanyl-D-alanine carboxypeptidase, partial [Arthrospira platensis SPKY1]|nr:D-alanyl-D-alanine carboxypeptidase [Arthrospira platensis SPKY1]